jgi:peptidylprolyl isomerase
MVRSRRFRKSQEKPEWGKNNPQAKKRNKKAAIIATVLLAVIAVVASLFFVFGQGLFTNPSSSPSPSSSSSPSASPSVIPSPTAAPLTSPAGEYSASGTRILLVTSMGNITIQLRDDKPVTSGNFKNLTELGRYDGTIFHRVIAGFMIQGGVIEDSSLSAIPDEIGNDNHNYNGTIAMANAGANTAVSSFFINVADNNARYSSFDTSYTVFGQVIEGMDVVMNISNVATGQSPYIQGETSYPTQEITLVKAMVLS